MSEEIKKGLLGIVVDETTISHVVPELSALTYRGYKVQDLCDKCDFEEVAFLVLHLGLPSNLDFKGKGEKFKIPESNVLIFGFLLFFVFGSGGIIMDWSTLWLSKDLNTPLYLASMGLIFFSIGGILANLFSNLSLIHI